MRKALALLAALLLVAQAQETLKLSAPVGRSVTLSTTTKTEMQLLDYFWPESLPRPVTNPTIFANTNHGSVTYRVVAPEVVEVTYRGKLPNLKHPVELRYRLRYRGDKAEVQDLEGVLAEFAKTLKLGPEFKDSLKDLLSGLPGFGQASVIPEYAVPLVPGARKVLAVPYLEGKTAETEVTYLGMKDGLHRFRVRTRIPYVELEGFKKLMPPGSVSLISVGPGFAEGETAFFPDGLPAGGRTQTETLSFTYLKMSDELAFLLAAKVRGESVATLNK